MNVCINNRGSLMTVGNTNVLIGYLMDFKDNGIFDANYGKLEVTPEEAKTHNELLSEGEIKGMDENCQVGQMGIFYFDKNKRIVHTWLGTLVSDNVLLKGKKISFTRKGKTFTGLLRKGDDDSFTFKRIS